MHSRNGETTDRHSRPEPKRARGSHGPTAKFDLKLDHIVDEFGGIGGLMDLARHCQDVKVRKVVTQWEGIAASQKMTASLDALCQEAGVTPGHFLGQMMAYCWKWNINAINLMTSQAMPGVIEKTIERAMESDGYRERKMLLQEAVQSIELASTTDGMYAEDAGADQHEGLLDFPRVEDDNVVDAAFRDLRDE